MIPLFFLQLFGIEAPKWLSGPLKWLADALIVLALLGGVYAWIEHRGETKGAAKQIEKAGKAHTKAVAVAVDDQHKAQGTADKIAASLARSDDATTDLVKSKMTEIHDAIDSTPPAVAGGGTTPVDTGVLSASINGLVDSANRAAEAADAQP